MFQHFKNWIEKISQLWLLIYVITGCTLSPNQKSNSSPIEHSIWNNLLEKYVDNTGMVNYIGFREDSLYLNEYLNSVSRNHPNEKNWSKDETLAYWINAYNAFTIQLILRHYPVESIKDIAGIIPFVNSPWDMKFIEIQGHEYDLNNIEHGIIRPNFNEPRIHFALVCAAVSCPSLRNEAYTGQKLNEQLDEQTRIFFNTLSKNEISSNSIKLSKLLYWYEGDFAKNGISLTDYINKYTDTTISSEAEISYMDYDWGLNEQ